MKEKILILLNVFVVVTGIAFLVYTFGFEDNPDYNRVAKVVAVLVFYLATIVSSMHREKANVYKVNKDAYGHIIKDVFSDKPKKYKRLMKGIKYYNRDKLETAIKKLSELLEECELDNESVVVEYFLGCSNIDAGYYDDAIENFNEVLVKDSTILEAINNLGVCYKANGNLEKAIKCFEDAIRFSLREAYVYNNLAQCHKARADWSKTLLYANDAMQIDANDTEAMALAYLACERLNDWNNAKRYKEMYFVNGGTKDDLEECMGELELSV